VKKRRTHPLQRIRSTVDLAQWCGIRYVDGTKARHSKVPEKRRKKGSRGPVQNSKFARAFRAVPGLGAFGDGTSGYARGPGTQGPGWGQFPKSLEGGGLTHRCDFRVERAREQRRGSSTGFIARRKVTKRKISGGAARTKRRTGTSLTEEDFCKKQKEEENVADRNSRKAQRTSWGKKKIFRT